jgi:hypothetical protein
MRLGNFKARIAQDGFAVDIGGALASFGISVKNFLDPDSRKGAGIARGGKDSGRGPGQRLAALGFGGI